MRTNKNLLQFAVRSRLKLFYRPAKLPGHPLKAPDKLVWTTTRSADGVALARAQSDALLHHHHQASRWTVGKTPATLSSGMVAPFGDKNIPCAGVHAR